MTMRKTNNDSMECRNGPAWVERYLTCGWRVVLCQLVGKQRINWENFWKHRLGYVEEKISRMSARERMISQRMMTIYKMLMMTRLASSVSEVWTAVIWAELPITSYQGSACTPRIRLHRAMHFLQFTNTNINANTNTDTNTNANTKFVLQTQCLHCIKKTVAEIWKWSKMEEQ